MITSNFILHLHFLNFAFHVSISTCKFSLEVQCKAKLSLSDSSNNICICTAAGTLKLECIKVSKNSPQRPFFPAMNSLPEVAGDLFNPLINTNKQNTQNNREQFHEKKLLNIQSLHRLACKGELLNYCLLWHCYETGCGTFMLCIRDHIYTFRFVSGQC